MSETVPAPQSGIIAVAFADLLNQITASLGSVVDKALSGRFWLSMAAAYSLVFIVESQAEVDPFVAMAIGSIITFYFMKKVQDNGAGEPLPPIARQP